MFTNVTLSTHNLASLISQIAALYAATPTQQMLNSTQVQERSDVTEELSVLGLTNEASNEEVRRAYKNLSRFWHPDKNTSSNATAMFQTINNAYTTITQIRIDNLSRMPKRIKSGETSSHYRNQETFLEFNSIYEIASEDLLELDGFAFDINELVLYAKNALMNLYKNPYLRSKNGSTDFSPAAIEIIRRHPKLAEYAQKLDASLQSQTAKISEKTVDMVIELLQAYEQHGFEKSLDAILKFDTYCLNLPKAEYKSLEDYIVKLSIKNGGTENLTFIHAIHGGNPVNPCIQTATLFGWQFVVDCRPEAIQLIPQSVKQLFSISRYVLNTHGQEVPEQVEQEQLTPVELLAVQVLTPQGLVTMLISNQELARALVAINLQIAVMQVLADRLVPNTQSNSSSDDEHDSDEDRDFNSFQPH